MFICEDCHKKANCDRGFIEGMLGSRGPCEVCHQNARCLDCHGYNFREPCTHESATGVDLAPDGPDKVWRCDSCGWLSTGTNTEDERPAAEELRRTYGLPRPGTSTQRARTYHEQISDLARIVRILNRQVKRGGPSNFEQVCEKYMGPELKAVYLETISLDTPDPTTENQ